MKYLQITDDFIRNLANSSTVSDYTREEVKDIVLKLGPTYSDFIYNVLTRHTLNYSKLNDKRCLLGEDERIKLSKKLRLLPVNLDESNILIADRVQLLYNTHERNYEEFSKFSLSFYELLELEIFGMDFNKDSETFLETIAELERLVSSIERLIIMSTLEEIFEDLIILGLGHRPGVIYIMVY